MIEKIVMDYLDDVMDDPAYMQEQDDEDRYYVVLKVGSGNVNRIDSAMIEVQSYAPSRYQAAQMNYAMIEAMDNIVTLDAIGSCKKNSDYDYTDTTKKGYRYQALFEIVHY